MPLLFGYSSASALNRAGKESPSSIPKIARQNSKSLLENAAVERKDPSSKYRTKVQTFPAYCCLRSNESSGQQQISTTELRLRQCQQAPFIVHVQIHEHPLGVKDESCQKIKVAYYSFRRGCASLAAPYSVVEQQAWIGLGVLCW